MTAITKKKKRFSKLRKKIFSFSTTSLRRAEQPTPDRPQIGASSLFDNVQVEAQEKLAKQEGKVMEKEVNRNRSSVVVGIFIFFFFLNSTNSLLPTSRPVLVN